MTTKAGAFLAACALFLALAPAALGLSYVQDFYAFCWEQPTRIPIDAGEAYQVFRYALSLEERPAVWEYVQAMEANPVWELLEAWTGPDYEAFALRYPDLRGFRVSLDGHILRDCNLFLHLRSGELTLYLCRDMTSRDMGRRSAVIPEPTPRPTPEPITREQPSLPEAGGASGTSGTEWGWADVEVPCPACGHSGRCAVCGGAGYLTLYGIRVDCEKDCPSCKGRGTLTQRRYQPIR